MKFVCVHWKYATAYCIYCIYCIYRTYSTRFTVSTVIIYVPIYPDTHLTNCTEIKLLLTLHCTYIRWIQLPYNIVLSLQSVPNIPINWYHCNHSTFPKPFAVPPTVPTEIPLPQLGLLYQLYLCYIVFQVWAVFFYRALKKQYISNYLRVKVKIDLFLLKLTYHGRLFDLIKQFSDFT